MDGDSFGTPPLVGGRSIDIELGGQEIVTIELDSLDENPDDFIDLLTDGNCKVSVWTKLACEYWRKGLLEAAEKVAEKAIEVFKTSSAASLPPVYQLLANIQLAHARKAPKITLDNPRHDDMRGEKLREYYHQISARHLNKGGDSTAGDNNNQYMLNAFLTRGIYQLARTSLDDALQSFDAVLSEKPTNLVALLGKAKIAYARKQYPQALKLFQQVLQLSPYSQPDPRIGIGLCFWAMDQKPKAKAAWERSLEVNPSNWAACLLLGLEAINSSKNPDDDEDERTANYFKGTKYTERAFKGNQRNAAAANALCDLFLRKGDQKRALKLAERTIQFADILALYSAGYIHAGYLSQMEGAITDAMRHFTAALKSNPKNVLAAIGLAQVQIKNDEIPAAIHTLDGLLQPPNPQRSLEAMVMLASLRASPRPGVSSADAAIERLKARDLFEHVLKALNWAGAGATSGIDSYIHRKAVANFGDDVDMLIEIARLWQDDNREKMRRVLEEAVRISEARGEDGKREPRLLNNVAVLRHLDGDVKDARGMYETALTEASAMGGAVGEGLATTILYNLARAYEDQGEIGIAKDAYDKLLGRHPEYTDAKIRQAYLLNALNRHEDAHELLKAANVSQKSNLNVRAALTHFLVSHQLLKLAKEFVIGTLKDIDGHDVYSHCALGWIQFNLARESRDPSPKALDERRKGFQRAAEFYERALQFDATCAFAAQGLAIITAEDVLSPLKVPGAGGAEEATRRIQSAREALDIFGKIRESVNDASVYVNMGHCYFVRDELDRAIESYETASKRQHVDSGPDVTILHCLCRAWYAKANKDQSFAAIKTALRYAQTALHIQPQEKVNAYNAAMIEQKAAEMLFAIPPAKRTLADLMRAVEQGAHATKLFASLAADKAPNVPYSRDLADQRRKYGDSMLRRGDEHIATQRKYEGEQEARLTVARARRQEEKERAEAVERDVLEQRRVQAVALAEERRKAREEAQQWTLAVMGDSDEEKEKRPRKAGGKKAQRSDATSAAASGDETEKEPKKKRKGKLKKEAPGDAEGGTSGPGEDEALFSGEEEDRPKKRPQKKRVVRDDDDDESAANAAPRKKQFKSKETISDSDEEMS